MTVYQNSFLGAPNWGDNATWVCKDLADLDYDHPNFPVDRLLDPQPRDRMQTLGVNEFYLEGSCDRRRAWNGVAMLFHNATKYGGFRIRSANTLGELLTNPFFDSSSYSGDPSKPFGYAVRFNGEAGDEASASSMNISGSHTIEVWFKAELLRQQGIVRLHQTDESRIYMLPDGKIRFSIYDGTASYIDTTAAIDPGQVIYHVAGVHDTGNNLLHIYVNGTLNNSGPAGSKSLSLGTSTITVAFDPNDTPDFTGWNLEGSILGVRLWDEVRNATDIGNNFDELLNIGKYSWHFNNGTGSTITAAQGGVNLSLSGNSFWSYPNRLWCGPDLEDWDRKHSLYFDFQGWTGQYMRINVIDETNSEGFFSCGRLFVTGAWQPSLNIEYGSGLFGFEDPGVINTLPSGIVTTREAVPVPVIPFSLMSTSKDEMMQLSHEMARLMGTTRPVLFVRDPGDPYYLQHQIHYGVLEAGTRAIEPAFNMFRQEFVIRGMQ